MNIYFIPKYYDRYLQIYLIRISNSYSIFFRVYDGISYGRKKKIPGKENFHANRSYYPSTNLKINITWIRVTLETIKYSGKTYG